MPTMRTLRFVVILLIHKVSSLTRLKVYTQPNYAGDWSYFDDLDQYYPNATWVGKSCSEKPKSIELLAGSCVVMYQSDPAYDKYQEHLVIIANTSNIKSLDGNWKNPINYVQACGNYTAAAMCPLGTIVKKMEWDYLDLTKGIRIYCSLPYSNSLSYTVSIPKNHTRPYSHSSEFLAKKYVILKKDVRKRVYESFGATSGEPGDFLRECSKQSAISGISIVFEKITNYVKKILLQCTKLPHVADTCIPTDRRDTIFSYYLPKDVGVSYRKFTFTKKAGLRKITSIASKLQSIVDMVYGSEAAILSNTMSVKLGYSKTTMNDWTRTNLVDFRSERSIPFTVRVYPGCNVTVEELVGVCSFYEIRPYTYRKRIDCPDLRGKFDEIIHNKAGVDFDTTRRPWMKKNFTVTWIGGR